MYRRSSSFFHMPFLFLFISEYNCFTCNAHKYMLACCTLQAVYSTVHTVVAGHKFSFTRKNIEIKRKYLRAIRAAPISTACRDGSHPSEATWPRAASKNEGTQVWDPIMFKGGAARQMFTWLHTCGVFFESQVYLISWLIGQHYS